MSVYYNDNEPYVAQWLRNLIAAGHLPQGDVDERDIREIEPDELRGYEQVHLFAGIGGWPHALELAGWRGPVWTASCPCQPLSSAGQRRGHADERHLWPAVYRLVAECRPATILGEQVASRDGREWLAGIRADLEHLGYAVGCADLPAAGVGAPHIRQRLWWLAHAEGGRQRERGSESKPRRGGYADGGDEIDGLGDAGSAGAGRNGRAALGAQAEGGGEGRPDGRGGDQPIAPGPWNNTALIPCADGKARRAFTGIQPLASRLPESLDGGGPVSRVGTLRAAGNAIVPQLAAEFIKASRSAISDLTTMEDSGASD